VRSSTSVGLLDHDMNAPFSNQFGMRSPRGAPG
jgi:hypothetical protein